jgi:hypothetical protein
VEDVTDGGIAGRSPVVEETVVDHWTARAEVAEAVDGVLIPTDHDECDHQVAAEKSGYVLTAAAGSPRVR